MLHPPFLGLCMGYLMSSVVWFTFLRCLSGTHRDTPLQLEFFQMNYLDLQAMDHTTATEVPSAKDAS